MVHTKERINDRDIDLFTLTDAARFEDKRADYWLKGAILKLWLAPSKDAPSAGKVEMTTSRSLPHRIQAIGEVSGHSADMDVEQTDQLIAYFADVAPPEPVTGPAAPVVPMAPGTIPPRDLSAPPTHADERTGQATQAADETSCPHHRNLGGSLSATEESRSTPRYLLARSPRMNRQTVG